MSVVKKGVKMGKVKKLVELKKALDFGLSIDIIKKMYLNTDGKLFFTYYV